MNNIHYKVGAGIVAAAIMTAALAPAAFAKVEITNNGKKSTNTVVATKVNATLVGQKSKTKANTTVTGKAKTGGNKANDNTGDGNVNIGTGPAANTTTVAVMGGSNDATLPESCGCVEDGDITIADNGRKSTNTVVSNNWNVTLVEQSSKTKADTTVDAVANTGHNKANDNTGDGAVSVQTGAATNTTTVTVEGGSNTLN